MRKSQAEVDVKNENGETPLHYAATLKNGENVIKVLAAVEAKSMQRMTTV